MAEWKNPIVFLDIKIGLESVGRIVIELRKDIVPKTVENFRSLCTGERGISENGTNLCYRGSPFHKIQRLFMSQGGDIVKQNGLGGESIYGPVFEDENFELLHSKPGIVSMVNLGFKNSNNSQFFITTVECPHLDGVNVAFGEVVKGLGVVYEMEKYTNDDGVPMKQVIIENCGELSPDQNWQINDNDETNDQLPPFPTDWVHQHSEFTVDEKLEILDNIKTAGNFFYHAARFVEAGRKYKKVTRYFNFFKDRTQNVDEKNRLDQFHLLNLLNYAATELKLGNYEDVCIACNSVLTIDPQNWKGLYRRGQAHGELKNYELCLEDLKRAHHLVPENKKILIEFERFKKYLVDYRQIEKKNYLKLFQ